MNTVSLQGKECTGAQPIKVDEPTVERAITILKNSEKYEDYHHVKYTNAAIGNAAISNRYIQDRFTRQGY